MLEVITVAVEGVAHPCNVNCHSVRRLFKVHLELLGEHFQIIELVNELLFTKVVENLNCLELEHFFEKAASNITSFFRLFPGHSSKLSIYEDVWDWSSDDVVSEDKFSRLDRVTSDHLKVCIFALHMLERLGDFNSKVGSVEFIMKSVD